MALKQLILACDNCEVEESDFESEYEALEDGWYILNGPQRDLGHDGVRAFCDRECLLAWL